MGTYQPGIPTGRIPLLTDYANVQNNFQQLDTQYGIDHVPFSNTSGTPPTGINGYHQSIHFNPQSTTATNPPTNYPATIPTVSAGFGQLYSVQENDGINTDTALYWLTGGGRLAALTRNFQPVAAQNGYTYLPGGLILQWARFQAATNSGTLAFNVAGISFPANCFLVILQGDDGTTANSNLLVTARSNLSFNFSQLNATKFYTYLALGN